MTSALYFNVLFTIIEKEKGYKSGDKVWIIGSVQKGDQAKKDIACKFGIPPNTLSTILKNFHLRIQRSKFRYLSKNECPIPFQELSNVTKGSPCNYMLHKEFSTYSLFLICFLFVVRIRYKV